MYEGTVRLITGIKVHKLFEVLNENNSLNRAGTFFLGISFSEFEKYCRSEIYEGQNYSDQLLQQRRPVKQ